MSLSSGKVALVRNQTALSCSTGCLPNTNIADFVGYGSSANGFEGSGPTATLTNTTSASRASSGCTDTDNNASDFIAGTVAPRNSATTAHSCGGSGAGGSGAGGSGAGGTGGTITLPSPTLAPVSVANLSFGIVGDTRPSSSTTGHYPSTVNTII